MSSADEPETAAEASESKRPRAKQCTDLQPIILALAKLQEDSNKLSFITYGDSSDDPQKAKLMIRGPNGVESNLQFLEIVGKTPIGKAKIKQVLAGMVKENKIKFSGGEKKQWTDTMCNRWRCLSRVVSLACAKEKPAAWTRMLPWMEGGDTLLDEDGQDEGDSHDEMQDQVGDETISIDGDSSKREAASQEEGGEQSAEEEEITDEKKNAEENADAAKQSPDGQQYLAESQETPIAEKATIKVDDGEALKNAADSTFDFKFSTELMLPLRLKK